MPPASPTFSPSNLLPLCLRRRLASGPSDRPAGHGPFFDSSLTASKMGRKIPEAPPRNPISDGSLQSRLSAPDVEQKKLVDDGRLIHQFYGKREAVPQPPPFSVRGSADGKEGTKNHPPIRKPKARSLLRGVCFVRPSERIYLSYSINSLSLFMLKVSHPKVSHW